MTQRLRQDNLAHLRVPAYDATLRPPPAYPVSADEVEPLIGPVQRSTPMPVMGGHGVLYKGQNGQVSAMLVSGGLARLSTKISRTAGTPLRGTGAEFWLLNGGRTVAVRSAGTVVSVTVSGHGALPRPDLLTELAAKIAARLDPSGPRDAGPEPTT